MPEQNKLSNIFISRFLGRLADIYLNDYRPDRGTLISFLSAVNALGVDFLTHLRSQYLDDVKIDYMARITPLALSKLNKSVVLDVDNTYGRLLETQDLFLSRINRYNGLYAQVKSKINRANSVMSAIAVSAEDNVYQISDSFNDITLIEPSSSELAINEEAGIATLPLNASSKIQISKIKILETSNGYAAIQDKNDIANLFDNNYDTWFQYERILENEFDTNQLQLDLFISLQNTQVINYLKLVPLILDEKAFPRIVDIQTSVDGREFRSIFDELPFNLDANELEEYLIMGPVGLRNQEYTEFHFTPRVAGYIKIKLSQGKKYKDGNRYKQRLSITELLIGSNSYASQGVTVSRPLTMPFIGRRFYIEPKQIDSGALASVEWEITVDGGTTWIPITPFETLEINTGSENSASASIETSQVIVRFTAKRNERLFNGLARPLASETQKIIQRFENAVLPLSIPLSSIPIEDSIQILNPVVTVGQNYGFELTPNFGNKTTANLPVPVKPLTEIIKVNGYKYNRIDDFVKATPNDRVYKIDYLENTVEFGDGLNGYAPDGPITFQLDPESVLLPDISPFTITLAYPHNSNSKDIKIIWLDRPRRAINELIPRGTNQIQLSNYPVILGVDQTESVPLSTNSFWLNGIPVSGTQIVFSDKNVFASRVYTTPTKAGEYQIKELETSQLFKPVEVITFTQTNPTTPGVVSFDAAAIIKIPQTAYTDNSWDLLIARSGVNNIIENYNIAFSDLSVFSNQKNFVDGSIEIEKAGDYSVDTKTGKVYSFSDISQTGNTSVSYTYQKEKYLNWVFGNNQKELIINDSSFLVNQNDDKYITLSNNNIKYYVVYKDNRYINIPIGAASPYIDNEIEIEHSNEDYITGHLLPTNRNKIKLPHANLVKNSIRFLFLSDDINAFDDRDVSRDSDGNITVLPLPVKDIYGNVLDATRDNNITQRDIDKATLTKERAFINGFEELEAGGDFSIDYTNGILYTYTPTSESTVIQYKYADVRVSYIGCKQLEQNTNYSLNITDLSLDINSADTPYDVPLSLLIQYEVISKLKQDPNAIIQYYSPIIMGYTLKVRPV